MASVKPLFSQHPERPVVIAGPCTAESEEILNSVVEPMVRLADELGFTYVFKASFDKANRTSIDSYRGPGLEKTMGWFQNLKKRFPGLLILTDIHEVQHVGPVAAVCDVLQIPAFLCRQTDLLIAAVESGRAVNVKKGQFLAPENTRHIVSKAKAVCAKQNIPFNLALTERGASFGYGNLVVDMRGFQTMSETGAPVIFDITHSLQKPAAGGPDGATTGGAREFAPALTRAATATGYLDGFFLEVHPSPAKAKSDADTQLTLEQAKTLLGQIIPLWRDARSYHDIDGLFRGV